MKIAAVIPARFASTRFPGKPLAAIRGRSMIERVYRRAERAGCFAAVLVATDDERIAAEVERFGGAAVMTPADIRSGSERVWAAIEGRPEFAAAINVQGDEPLIPAELLIALHGLLQAGRDPVVSAVTKNERFDDFLSPHVVKAVLSTDERALYFSRSPIPNCDRARFSFFHQHIGVYGYSREALRSFVQSDPAPLESIERLEQLRFLANGVPIRLVMTDYRAHGVDVPGDIARIEELLRGEDD